MKKAALFLLFFSTFFWYGSVAFAQKQGQALIDSLLPVLKAAKEDSSKVNTLNAIAWEMKSMKPDTSIILSTEALQLAEKIKWELGVGRSHRNLGVFFNFKGDNIHALAHYAKALETCDELEKSPRFIGTKSQILNLKLRTLSNIGTIYMLQGDYAQALDHYFKSMKMAEELGDKNRIAGGLCNIGIIYHNQGDEPKALDYYLKSLKMAEELGDKELQAGMHTNIASTLNKEGDYPKALDSYSKALKIREELGDKNGTAVALSGIGDVYSNQGDYTKALNYFLKTLKITEELGDKGQQSGNLYSIGATYIKQKKIKKPDNYLQHALSLSTETKTLEKNN